MKHRSSLGKKLLSTELVEQPTILCVEIYSYHFHFSVIIHLPKLILVTSVIEKYQAG